MKANNSTKLTTRGTANTSLIIIAVVIAVVLSYFVFSGNGLKDKNSGTPDTNIIQIEPDDVGGLANVPDFPLASVPTDPISVKFLAEHRTALHGKEVLVKGFIIEAILGEDACPTKGGTGGCAQPRLFIADDKNKLRDKRFDLMILLNETDKTDYKTGEEVKINGVVSASKVAVVVDKIYKKF